MMLIEDAGHLRSYNPAQQQLSCFATYNSQSVMHTLSLFQIHAGGPPGIALSHPRCSSMASMTCTCTCSHHAVDNSASPPGVEGAVALCAARQQAVLFDGDVKVRQNLLYLLLLVGGAHIEGLIGVAHPDEGSVTSQDDSLLCLCHIYHLPAATYTHICSWNHTVANRRSPHSKARQQNRSCSVQHALQACLGARPWIQRCLSTKFGRGVCRKVNCRRLHIRKLPLQESMHDAPGCMLKSPRADSMISTARH